jgi:hypothetical protein
MVSLCIRASSIHRLLYFLKKIKISISSGISKFPKDIVYGQILADFGSFGQFWVDLGRFCCIANGLELFGQKCFFDKQNGVELNKTFFH